MLWLYLKDRGIQKGGSSKCSSGSNLQQQQYYQQLRAAAAAAAAAGQHKLRHAKLWHDAVSKPYHRGIVSFSQEKHHLRAVRATHIGRLRTAIHTAHNTSD